MDRKNQSIAALTCGINIACWAVLLGVVVYWFGYTTTLARILLAAIGLAFVIFRHGTQEALYGDVEAVFSEGSGSAQSRLFFAGVLSVAVAAAVWYSVPLALFLIAILVAACLIAVASMAPSTTEEVVEEEVDGTVQQPTLLTAPSEEEDDEDEKREYRSWTEFLDDRFGRNPK